MTISATYAWEPSRDQVIKNALHGCGQLNASASPNAHQKTVGAEMLQTLLHGLQKRGVHLNRIERYAQSITAVTAAVPYIAAPADTVDVEQGASVRSSDGTTEHPVSRITVSEYQALTQKQTSGQPTMYCPEKQSNGTFRIYLYPWGDTANWTYLVYPRVREPRDLDSGTVTLDVPPSWMEAVTAGLMWKFSQHYKLPLERVMMFREDWRTLRDEAMDDETERGNLVLIAEPLMDSGF